MKNWILFLSAGILAVILVIGCVSSEPLLTKNKYEYDSRSQRNDILERREQKPAWHSIKGEQSRIEWQEAKDPNGNLLFYYGSSQRSNASIAKEGLYTWSRSDASTEAFEEILRNYSIYVNSNFVADTKIKLDEKTEITTSTEQSTVKSKKQKEKKPPRETTTKSSFSSKSELKSSVNTSGLIPMDDFWETYEQVIKGKTIIVTHVWSVYSVTKIIANQARETQERLAGEKLDEKIQQEMLKNEQEKLYVELESDYRIIIGSLAISDISQYSNDEKYKRNYLELLSINNKLKYLNTLSNRNDDIGTSYRNLMRDVGDKIVMYDPENRQSNSIGRLVSQQFIIPFPHRPIEIMIPQARIYVSKEMISNREYISFDSTDGSNGRSRRENGLDVTAVSVSWEESVRYCNFLSNFYGLMPYYIETNRQITGYNKDNNGYRLPNRDEITAMLEIQPGFIDEREFKQISIWSSDGSSTEHVIYKLSGNPGSASDRLLSQSVRNTISDPSIGFRVVRNAE